MKLVVKLTQIHHDEFLSELIKKLGEKIIKQTFCVCLRLVCARGCVRASGAYVRICVACPHVCRVGVCTGMRVGLCVDACACLCVHARVGLCLHALLFVCVCTRLRKAFATSLPGKSLPGVWPGSGILKLCDEFQNTVLYAYEHPNHRDEHMLPLTIAEPTAKFAQAI